MPAPFRLPPLDAATHQAVTTCYESTDDPEMRTRCQMILLASETGKTTRQVALIVRRSHDTVLRVLQRFAAGGVATLPRQYQGSKPTVTPEWQAELQRVVDLDPHTVGVASANWTTGLLAEYLGQQTGISVGAETVREYLHRFDYVCKRPTWTVAHKASEREDWVGNGCGWRCS